MKTRKTTDMLDTIINDDCIKVMGEMEEKSVDLVFADPPYALKALDSLPDLVLKSQILADDGLFVLEHGKDYDFSSHPSFVEHRAYGSVNFSFFRHVAS